MINKKSLANLRPAKKGEIRNPAGMPKDLKSNMNAFKSAMFELFKNNQAQFEKAALANPIETLKLLSRLCPQEISGDSDLNVTIKWAE